MFSISQVLITYSYLPPQEPPSSGKNWDPFLDYPGVRVTAQIQGQKIPAEIVDPTYMFFGKLLTPTWGEEVGLSVPYRTASVDFRRPLLSEAESDASIYAESALSNFEANILMPRQARLRMREETIKAALASRRGLVRIEEVDP